MRRRLLGGLLGAALFLGLILPAGYADKIAYKADGRRDPFIPLIGPGGLLTKAPKKTLTVEGIIYDPQGTSLVIIGGESYREGESLFGANIISIFQDRIVVSQEDEEATIWIHEEIFKGERSS